ncbi:DUF1523 family protein [Actibacterium sp. XHP0104]|uniref:DUF1523 family protein n=1 Tax=Actibacterium sp. XHP0104 TaxID=2984335 RepID=UPI0021E8F6A9|nr:DUF1523 family protein [Actibacterium sp. XHP0104]MCV2882308.1 DUF1523 family protein [Actibacterium sp. XHP0104]
MRYVKWTIITVLVLLVFGFFHYTLPQRDIVRIVNTYEERQDLNGWTRMFWSSPDDNSDTLANRDVQFIQAIQANGKTMVYRNEDTGWGWPPYFKFDTANLYAEANDAISSKDAPEWYAIRHYGWRNEFLSIFPNAVGLKRVDGPDVRLIPYGNIVMLTLLALFVGFLYRVWAQFRERTIDPLLEDAGETWDAVDERADAARDKARGMWGRLRDRMRR